MVLQDEIEAYGYLPNEAFCLFSGNIHPVIISEGESEEEARFLFLCYMFWLVLFEKSGGLEGIFENFSSYV